MNLNLKASSPITFDEKVVVITGAGNGLGKAHAEYFAALGAKLVVNDLGGDISGKTAGQQNIAELVVQSIKDSGGEAIANNDSVVDGEKIIEQALDVYGRVDVLINNAGILRDKSFHKMSKDDWMQVQDVHLNGAFAMCHAAWPHFRTQQYGRIIFTLSAAGLYGNFGQANYSAAKMGMLGLMNTLAIEGASKNIHANAIAPLVDSRMLESFLDENTRSALKPQAVSALAAFLSHETCEENGSIFEAGGNWYGKLNYQRSNGLFIKQGDNVSADDIASNWQEITDMSQVHYPENNAEAVSYILNGMKTGMDQGGCTTETDTSI